MNLPEAEARLTPAVLEEGRELGQYPRAGVRQGVCVWGWVGGCRSHLLPVTGKNMRVGGKGPIACTLYMSGCSRETRQLGLFLFETGFLCGPGWP